jgi:hypothetical protein
MQVKNGEGFVYVLCAFSYIDRSFYLDFKVEEYR